MPMGSARTISGGARHQGPVGLRTIEWTIFGLVAAFLTKDWRLYLFPWALAIVGFIRELPRESSRTAP
jgi:hypothetical protein